MKIAVFWVVGPCSMVEVYQRFGGTCYLHLRAIALRHTSYSPPWEPQISFNKTAHDVIFSVLPSHITFNLSFRIRHVSASTGLQIAFPRFLSVWGSNFGNLNSSPGGHFSSDSAASAKCPAIKYFMTSPFTCYLPSSYTTYAADKEYMRSRGPKTTFSLHK
jgi:hypothetical protein